MVAEGGEDGGGGSGRVRPRCFRGSWAREGRRRVAGRHGEDDDIGGDGRSVLERRLEVTGGAAADGELRAGTHTMIGCTKKIEKGYEEVRKGVGRRGGQEMAARACYLCRN